MKCIQIFLLFSVLGLASFAQKPSPQDSIMSAQEGHMKTRYAYGYACGFIGEPPELRSETEHWIEQKYQSIFIDWLYSDNLVVNAYAVEALSRLETEGIQIAEKDLAQIRSLKNKNDLIITCSGCVYYEKSISEVLKPFEF